MTRTTPNRPLTAPPARAFSMQSALWCALLLALSPAAADEIGIPWTGQPGVTETVTDIMARYKNLPLQSSMQPAQSDEGRLLPNRQNLAQYSLSPRVSRYPATSSASSAEATALITSQSIGSTFLGAQLSEAGFVPPDSMGAVGPSQVLVCVNGRIKVFDKSGALGALHATTKTFFGSLGINSPSDPLVRY